MTLPAAGAALPRLSAATLAAALPRDGVTGPPPGDLGARIGVLHLGIGAFHRAHQAVYTEDAAAAAGDGGWGVCGVTQRSPDVADRLLPQDCRYGVLQRGHGTASLRVVGQVGDVLHPARDGDRLAARLADPAVRVIGLTVTEKGYRRGPDGRLDLADPAVAADLATAGPPDVRAPFGSGDVPRSAVGLLARGLAHRAAVSGAPVTVLTCDNLTDNGPVLRGLVADFCAALPAARGEPLAAWIAAHVTFPATMVDRIVPATTDADRAQAAALLGLRDDALVVAEPFRQWVVQDAFAAGRPRWELAGAQLVPDVAPYEQLKLRLLNGTHSLLAYLGALAGHGTIAEAVADPDLADAAEALLADAAATLDPPPGVDVAAYGRSVLDRFADPALRHRTTQIAMDGSQKLPPRLLGTIRDARAAGTLPRGVIRAVAGWMAYVTLGADVAGRPLPLDDPLADRLRSAVAGAGDAAAVADALLAVRAVFPAGLADDVPFRECLVHELGELLARSPSRR